MVHRTPPTPVAAVLNVCACDLSAGNCYARGGILHFLLYDPSYSPTPDPRPALPLTFTDPSLGRVLARTGWTQSATSFAYKCSWWVRAHD